MSNSWKIGAVSGLIAGIVLGIVAEIFGNIRVLAGLYDSGTELFLTGNIFVNVPLFGFWGIILGVIYSKTYNVIPRKNILKGLIYGLILYILIVIRINFFYFAYGYYLDAVGHIFSGFFMWLSYGLVLGFLYKSFHEKYSIIEEEKKIIQYDLRSGVFPGAISGFISGFAVSIFSVLGNVTGYYGIAISPEGQVISTIDYWISQMGSHIFINLFWGAIFGAIFAFVYNLIPSKKVKKGLCYGLLLLLITTFQIGTWITCWAALHNLWPIAINSVFTHVFLGVIQFGTFGLVLGLLYRKPSE